ncbi:DUF397 domain-containing protein [Nocardiopsis sp. NPDC049922]|uniref:DUF397 domain-containing protein n=1 Tax=Nocardiopsis sp. NPDC049922 TaxID=3155157 RepID=UPI0033F5114B
MFRTPWRSESLPSAQAILSNSWQGLQTSTRNADRMTAPANFAWFKSSYSGSETHCVEVAMPDPSWFKSSYSGTVSDCVETAHLPRHVAMRDSKHPDHLHLVFGAREWRALVAAVDA